MAENEERESKTEEPTEKRLSDATERGNVPFARELTTLGSLAAILAASAVLVERAGKSIGQSLGTFLGGSGSFVLENRDDAGLVILQLLNDVFVAILPILALLSLGGVIGSLIQNIPQANLQRISPSWSKVSPGAGWKRLFGIAGIVEFAKSVLKIGAASTIAVITVKPEITAMQNTLEAEPVVIPRTMLNLSVRVMVALVAISSVMALADVAWARFKWRRDLRMTRQEIKDEHKQAEGDPLVKFRIRTIARQRISRRMMAKLPTATMVVTNPTHYAVALRYAREEGGAPVVIAKGIDHLALRIRELAQSNEIPIVENKPLARALYEKVAIEQSIPEEFYKAVAEIIHFLQIRNMYGQPRTS